MAQQAGLVSDVGPNFFEKLIPTVIGGEEQLCGARNIHDTEYKTVLKASSNRNR
ncbi:hypothetical protein ECP030477710_5031 [Escherichia coli P0304777.10]|nr:hypothetical protein EC2875000_5129 [Escherichia coli 2875000]EMV50282.1 hypothetical protein EC2872800_5043 [Escherichia coli 2872800]EMV59935.1 hypothetical protein EC2867750_1855 [Escherichia coli 2867750]EMV64939.1 hypothetical protein EC2866750_5359 [Escherichia coli 2866750]EMW01417.1 hypothetical protein EC2851500_2869 [Escherichia coli 2851500]EMW12408.1 hypothetical protein EC2850750_5206 [Escherichia coli 2850750]EMW12621.1 hypothetical protein EC2850400_5139 [Escherichia coli 28